MRQETGRPQGHCGQRARASGVWLLCDDDEHEAATLPGTAGMTAPSPPPGFGFVSWQDEGHADFWSHTPRVVTGHVALNAPVSGVLGQRLTRSRPVSLLHKFTSGDRF